MKESEQLLVMSKKLFFLISSIIFFVALGIGYTIGYVTKPVKEVHIKTVDNDKPVLPAEPKAQQESLPQQKQEVQIVQEVEAKEEKSKEIEQIHKNLYEKSIMLKRKQILKYTLQVGAFDKKINADRLLDKLRGDKIKAYIVKEDYYKVRVGYYRSFKEAIKASERLKSLGIENFVKKIK
ncbi:MAG: SPOR domain-containing protein [Thermodesulfovibrionaceae bacterium]